MSYSYCSPILFIKKDKTLIDKNNTNLCTKLDRLLMGKMGNSRNHPVFWWGQDILAMTACSLGLKITSVCVWGGGGGGGGKINCYNGS